MADFEFVFVGTAIVMLVGEPGPNRANERRTRPDEEGRPRRPRDGGQRPGERDQDQSERRSEILAAQATRRLTRLVPFSGSESVSVSGVSKVYEPYPLAMKVLLRSSIKAPITALDDVTFTVARGSILAVVGPNGAGKSTLFRVLTGLTTPTSGTAMVCGLNSTTQSFLVRQRIGFAPADDRTLLLRLTCRENLMFHGDLQGISSRRLRRQIDETLTLVGLERARDRTGFALSSGMRSRLQVARALLHMPEVLILDEPTGSIDPLAAYELLEIIRQIVVERGIAALISSHRLEEIEALHDNVILMDQGRIVHRGDLDGLRAMWEPTRIELTFADEPSAVQSQTVLEQLDRVHEVDRAGEPLTVAADADAGYLLQALVGRAATIRSVRDVKLPLRDLLAKMLRPKSSS